MDETREGGHDHRITVVINRSAGAGDVDAARAAFEELRAAGRAVIRETDGDGLAPAVRAARSSGSHEIVAVGGDGSIRRVAREMAGTGMTLIPAPGGTLNHFPRRYGIETLTDAAALVGRGRVEEVPLGVADDQLFLNTLVLGAYAAVLRTRDRMEDVVGKWAGAGVGFAGALIRLPRVRVVIRTETRKLDRTTGMVWVGLGRGSWPLSHRIRRDIPDPTLDVVVLRDLGRVRTAAWLGRLLAGSFGLGDPGEDGAIERFQARALVVSAEDTVLEATFDGDPATFASPLFISTVDRALRIRVPS